MQSLVLLVLLVAVASAAYTYRSHYTPYSGAYSHYTPYSHRAYGAPHHTYRSGLYHPSVYSHYRGRREAEAEPQPEAEADAEAGTYVYNTVPHQYTYPHYSPYYNVAPTKTLVKSTIPATVPLTPYTYSPYGAPSPYYTPYAHHAGVYGFNPLYNPYHPQYLLKPVEEADEPTAATSDDTVEISRKRREAEAEPEAEADPALKVVSHHVAPYPYTATYTGLSPYSAHHVAPITKVVKTYAAPAHTYSTYSGFPYYSRPYGFPYNRYLH